MGERFVRSPLIVNSLPEILFGDRVVGGAPEGVGPKQFAVSPIRSLNVRRECKEGHNAYCKNAQTQAPATPLSRQIHGHPSEQNNKVDLWKVSISIRA